MPESIIIILIICRRRDVILKYYVPYDNNMRRPNVKENRVRPLSNVAYSSYIKIYAHTQTRIRVHPCGGRFVIEIVLQKNRCRVKNLLTI